MVKPQGYGLGMWVSAAVAWQRDECRIVLVKSKPEKICVAPTEMRDEEEQDKILARLLHHIL